MSKDVYATALRNTLTEIKKIYPDINHSFIFTKHGVIVARDEESVNIPTEKAVHLFQSIAEKAVAVGGLHTLLVKGNQGKVYISCVNEMLYLAMTTPEDADTTYLNSVTQVIVPTILKILESIAPTPFKFLPSQQLIVDSISGFFANDVQVDEDVLEKWSKLLDGKTVNEVEVEAFGGKKTRCKVKAINDPALAGKGLIRIPEKTCQTLETKKGELVRVKPIAS